MPSLVVVMLLAFLLLLDTRQLNVIYYRRARAYVLPTAVSILFLYLLKASANAANVLEMLLLWVTPQGEPEELLSGTERTLVRRRRVRLDRVAAAMVCRCGLLLNALVRVGEPGRAE